MATKVDKLLAQAKKAYQNKDKRIGKRLIDQILQEDFLHEETWRFLHQLAAPNQPFEQFRYKFTQTNYPDKLPLLQALGAGAAPAAPAGPPAASPVQAVPPPKKESFFARLFGIFKRAPKAQPQGREQPALPPVEAHPARPVSQGLISRPREGEQPPTPPAPIPQPAISAPPVQAGPPVSPAAPESSFAMPLPAPLRAQPGSKTDKIRVLVVDDIPQTRTNVIRALRFQDAFDVVGTATNGQQGVQLAMELQPDVIIMDVNMPGMDGIAATSHIKRNLPATEIIIMTVQDDADYMRQAMSAGARDFLAKPPMVDDLIQAVKRAGAMARETYARLHPVVERAAEAAPLMNGKVITVYSPRGGAGCTTLAVNLAAVLHSAETPVVVVDANLQFGDVPVFFNSQSRYTILDLAPHAEELDAQTINEILAQHASGIRLLGPPRPEQAEIVNSWQFNQVIKYLRGLYAYIIIDTTHRLTDITLASLDNCDAAVILAVQDIPALARLRQFLDLAPALGLDSSNILMAINLYNTHIGISSEKIGQVLRQKIAAVIPVDKAAAIPAMNRGAPFMLQQEVLSRPIARAVQGLKDVIIQRLDHLERSAKEAPPPAKA